MPSSKCICILLLIFGTVAISAKSNCTSSTCLNGGECDRTYEGPGVKCLCPVGSPADYGPLCELYTRSYSSAGPFHGTNYAATWHTIPAMVWRKHTWSHVTISFDFNGQCPEDRCPILVAMGGNGDTPMVLDLLRSGQLSLTLKQKFNPISAYVRNLELVVPVNVSDFDDSWRGHWRSVSLFAHPSPHDFLHYLGDVVYCSHQTRLCASTVNKNKYWKGVGEEGYKKLKIKVGHGLNGCIRNLLVDTVPVDIGKVDRVDGDPSRTKPGCSAQEATCAVGSSVGKVAAPICGRNSVCYGSLPHLSSETHCSCRCTNGKIKERETVTNPQSCTIGGRPNECTKDAPVLNMGSKNYRVEWSLQDGGAIPHNSFQTKQTNNMELSIGLEFKTYFQPMVMQRIIEIKQKEQLMAIAITAIFQVFFYYRGVGMYHLMTTHVFDGNWHYASMSIKGRAIFLTVDDRIISYPFYDLSYYHTFTVEVGAPHTCVRNVRVGNVYMPVGYGDPTADNSTYYVKMKAAVEGAVAWYECDNRTISEPYKEPSRPPPTTTTAATTSTATTTAAAAAAATTTGPPTPQSTARTSNMTSAAYGVCKCSDLEDCVTLADHQECLCKVGLYRNSSGLCALDPRLRKVLSEMASNGGAASVHWSAARSLHFFLSVLLMIYCSP